MFRCRENVQKIFEFWCEVSTSSSVTNSEGSTNNNNGSSQQQFFPHQISTKFPESFNDKQILLDIPHFAFPCEFEK